MATATAPRSRMTPAAANAAILESIEHTAAGLADARQTLAEIHDAIRQIRARLDTIAPAPARQPEPPARRPEATTPAPARRAEAPRSAEPRTAEETTGSPPRSGRQMYAWARENGLLDAVMEIGQGRGYPTRIVTWTPQQTDTAYGDLFDLCDRAPIEGPNDDYGY